MHKSETGRHVHFVVRKPMAVPVAIDFEVHPMRTEPRLDWLAILIVIVGILVVIFAVRYVHHHAVEQHPKATLHPK